MKDTDFLFLTAMLSAREARMLSKEKIGRMLDAQNFDDAAKTLADCGYPDMSGMNISQAEEVLTRHRRTVFDELANNSDARMLADLFRMKYDYHNIKVLVKSMAANTDASSVLSDSGRISAEELTEAFISGERQYLPPPLTASMSEAVGILSRTHNPQLADVAVDKAYFRELLSLAQNINDDFTTGYIRLLIDSANLRTLVRALRIGRDTDFLKTALIPGGNADTVSAADYKQSGAALSDIFTDALLENAVRLGAEAISGGGQTAFELACDDAVLYYISSAALLSFGPAHVTAYLAELEWEITAARMILTGKLAGVSPDIIRERLRECYV